MRIDAHQYFWKYQTGQFKGQPQDRYDVLKNDYLPHDMLVSLVNNEIEGSIVVQNSDTVQETNFLLELSESHDFVRGVIGWIDLENPNIGQKINFYNNTRLVGFRESFVKKEDSYFAMRKEVIRGIELVQEYNFPIDIQCRPDQFPAVIDLVSILVDQKFVLNGLGFVPHSAASLTSWKGLLALIAQYPNVYCKINGLFAMEKLIGLPRKDIEGCLRFVIDLFSAERIIFGSDWPYVKIANEYSDQVQWLEQVFDSLTRDEIDHIFGRTASVVYLES